MRSRPWCSSVFLRAPFDFIGPRRFHFQTQNVFKCGAFICRALWQRRHGNLQLPARYFGCSLSKITQIHRWTAVGGWLEWCLERASWTGLGFCCKYPRQNMVLHQMQKLLEFGKACCHFACTSLGSTFALLASFFFFVLPPFCRPHKSVQKSLQIPLGAEGRLGSSGSASWSTSLSGGQLSSHGWSGLRQTFFVLCGRKRGLWHPSRALVQACRAGQPSVTPCFHTA